MVGSFKFMKPTYTNGICKMASTSLQIAFFYSFLYIIAVDASGKKPNISTFGADQFDDFDPDEENIKASFFSRRMFSSFVRASCATLGLVYIQENMRSGLGYVIRIVGYLVCCFPSLSPIQKLHFSSTKTL